MTYRDDHAAAIARIDALEHDNAVLAKEAARLEGELAHAREWLGGPRKRLALVIGGATAAAAVAAGAYALGRSAAPDPVTVAAPAPEALPRMVGNMLGWDHLTGPWTMSATRCAVRGEGVELTAAGSSGHSLWLGPDGVELELPSATVSLDQHRCYTRLDHELVRHDETSPPTFSGFVALDCRFDGDVVIARVDFRSCR